MKIPGSFPSLRLDFNRGALVLVGAAVVGSYLLVMTPAFLGRGDDETATAARPAVYVDPNREVEVVTKPRGAIAVDSSAKLADLFRDFGFQLAAASDRVMRVPRIFVSTLPGDLPVLRSVDRRKSVFIKTMLPLVLATNERIMEKRRRIEVLAEKAEGGALDSLSESERQWLEPLWARNSVTPGDFETLLRRVDIVPPSLALAQAAEESGWGTSRFAQQANALFGQWTWKGKGLVPEERDTAARHKIRTFPRLQDAVDAYVRNLNTHPAYKAFRAERAAMRARDGAALDAYDLARTLTPYSTRREAYVDSLHEIMRANRLQRFDEAELSDLVEDEPLA